MGVEDCKITIKSSWVWFWWVEMKQYFFTLNFLLFHFWISKEISFIWFSASTTFPSFPSLPAWIVNIVNMEEVGNLCANQKSNFNLSEIGTQKKQRDKVDYDWGVWNWVIEVIVNLNRMKRCKTHTKIHTWLSGITFNEFYLHPTIYLLFKFSNQISCFTLLFSPISRSPLFARVWSSRSGGTQASVSKK